jgi:L-ascorbate metabolism protein UlaG (beta-lactamase superfamily)
MRTLRRLNREATLIIPENVKPLVEKLKFRKVIELANWENYSNGNVEIHALPVKHNKGRLPFLFNTGTNSYYVKLDRTSFYFLGDSAYFKEIKKIGEKFDINFAFLPIGGFKPEIIFKNFHMNPYQAVQAFLDLGAKCLVPIHYGTFHVIPPFVKIENPLKKLEKAVKDKNLKENLIIVKPNCLVL